MKKIFCFIVTLALLVTSSAVAFAKPERYNTHEKKSYTKEIQTKEVQPREVQTKYDLKHSKVIKYGRYQLPVTPITKGMGATVNYDKATAVITITKADTKLVIDLKNKKVTVNGVEDTSASIFNVSNSKKKTILIKYIAEKLGVRVKVGKDDIEIVEAKLEAPKNVNITTFVSKVVYNTLNATTQYMEVSADITPGQATGGKAELYVNTKLVATNNVISATGSAITFTTSDGTPTNDELKAAVPEGGAVTIKLYNAKNEVVTSKSDLKLNVDYIAPTLTSIASAVYMQGTGELYLSVAGAGQIRDVVDITMLSLFDSTLARSYRLTNIDNKGSKGFVESATSIKITLGEADKAALAGFGTSTVSLYVSAGALISDQAGNTSPVWATPINVPVVIIK